MYMHKHIWINGRDEINELVLQEGVVSGRQWVLIKQWFGKPRYKSERIIKYIVRIDFSEWANVYLGNFHKIYKKLCIENGRFVNSSPGWWDNGFVRQLCFEMTVFQYESVEERLKEVISTGTDFDTIDYNDFMTEFYSRNLKPTINVFEQFGKACVPRNDF